MPFEIDQLLEIACICCVKNNSLNIPYHNPPYKMYKRILCCALCRASCVCACLSGESKGVHPCTHQLFINKLMCHFFYIYHW